jgi:hypothetical protein
MSPIIYIRDAARRTRNRWQRHRQAVSRDSRRNPLTFYSAVSGFLALFVAVLTLSPVSKIFTSDEVRVSPVPYMPPGSPAKTADSSAPKSTSQAGNHQRDAPLLDQLSPSYIVPGSLRGKTIPSGDDPAKLRQWAESLGGVYAEVLGVSFAIQADTPDAAVLTDLKINVVKRNKPLAGTWILPANIGGSMTNRRMIVNLDQDPPSVQKEGGWDFPLSVSSENPEFFSIQTMTTKCDCSWTFTLFYTDAGGHRSERTIDDDGKPFRITGVNNASAHVAVARTPGGIGGSGD